MAFADAQSAAVIKFGESATVIQVVGTVTKGDALGFSGGWKRALATVGSLVQMRCIAGDDGVDGQKITAYFGTTIIEGDRFSGATAGGAIYIAEGTSNGQYTQTVPSTTGDSTKIVGYALSATEIALTPNANVDSIA